MDDLPQDLLSDEEMRSLMKIIRELDLAIMLAKKLKKARLQDTLECAKRKAEEHLGRHVKTLH